MERHDPAGFAGQKSCSVLAAVSGMLNRGADNDMAKQSILHVCGREIVLELRNEILRIQGYEVFSTLDISAAMSTFLERPYSLVLIDVEGEGRVSSAEHLCELIRNEKPEQKVAFLCNHRVSIESDCPDEVIRAEFNPAAMIRGVEDVLKTADS